MNDVKTILIIEDDVFVTDIYKTRLSQEGYRVITAGNGEEGIMKIKNDLPDMILLDIVMPKMDGMEALKLIKRNNDYKDIPVMLLTNLSQKEDVDQGLALGAVDYIIKSHFTPSEVVEKIKLNLDKK